jgi:hypothetical protein
MTRRETPIVLLIFIATALLFAWVGMRPEFNGLLSDSYVYLAAAEATAPGAGHDPRLVRHLLDAYPFPPLYPVVLGLLGGGSTAPATTYVIGAVTLALVCVLMQRWLRSVGVAPLAATLASLTFAALPLTLQSAMGVLSEPLYMLCVLGAALAPNVRRPTVRHWWLAALLVALAALTRSVGVAAVAAFGLCWLFAGAWRVTRAAPLLAALPPLGWAVYKQLAGFGDYALETVTARDPLAMIAVNAQAWRQYAVRAVDLAARDHTALALAALGVLAAGVWLVRLLRGRFDAWHAAIYVAIMMVWPHPHHAARFLFVLLPFAIGYPVLALQALAARLRVGAALLPALAPALLLVLALPSTTPLLGTLWRQRAEPMATALRGPAWYQSNSRQASRSMAFSRRLAGFQSRHLSLVPDGACVASIIPQQVLVYGPRAGIDLTKVRARGQTLEQALAQCPYVLMVAARPYPPVTGIGSLFPFDEIRDRMEVLAFERARPDDPQSPPIALLAKVR